MKLVSALGLEIPFSLKDQDPGNLRELALQRLQYDFLNDMVSGLKGKTLPSPNPGYSYKVYMSPTPEQSPGSIQEYAIDERVEVSIESEEGAQAFLYPNTRNERFEQRLILV